MLKEGGKDNSKIKIAIYPGTFDPVTYGHLDVLERARRIFDKVIVGIAVNTSKKPVFSVEERKRLIAENIRTMEGVEVKTFQGLTVNFAKEEGATAIVRGLRAVSDFEYEFQLAQMNRHMEAEVETIFLMPNHEYFYTSSQLIRAIAHFEAERVADFVPKNVLEALKSHYAGRH